MARVTAGGRRVGEGWLKTIWQERRLCCSPRPVPFPLPTRQVSGRLSHLQTACNIEMNINRIRPHLGVLAQDLQGGIEAGLP